MATTAMLVSVGYVIVLRRRPAVDKELYGSIYGAELDDGAPSQGLG